MQARAAAMGATSMSDKAQAENQLSQTLKSIFAVAEAYPELKASQNFMQLQDDLKDAEELIAKMDIFVSKAVNDMRVFKLRNALSDEMGQVLSQALTANVLNPRRLRPRPNVPFDTRA